MLTRNSNNLTGRTHKKQDEMGELVKFIVHVQLRRSIRAIDNKSSLEIRRLEIVMKIVIQLSCH